MQGEPRGTFGSKNGEFPKSGVGGGGGNLTEANARGTFGSKNLRFE